MQDNLVLFLLRSPPSFLKFVWLGFNLKALFFHSKTKWVTLKANELILKKRRSNKAVSRLELKTTKRCKLSAIVELKSIITVMARLIEVECALCVNLCVYLFFFFFFFNDVDWGLFQHFLSSEIFSQAKKTFFFLCEKACARLRLETRTRNRENLKAS